jgi:hypothetical protein
MKQRLLSVLAFAAMTVTAMAQTWTEPVAPVAPSYDEGEQWTFGQSYYIKNVGAGQYLTGANNWATQISLSSDAKPFMKFVIEELEDDSYLGCVKIKVDGSYKTYGGNGYEGGRDVGNTYLFRDNETSGFIDHNNQACWYWYITEAENGAYYIQSAPGMNNWNADESEFMVGNGAGAACIMNGAQDNAQAQWLFINADLVDLEAIDQYTAAKAIYDAKIKLYNLLNDATKYGADTSAAGAVFNNANATAAEINAAYDALLKQMPAAVIAYATNHGTSAEPFAMPYVFYNADFSLGNMNGWTIAKPEGATGNYQYQGSKYVSEDGQTTIQGFIESWVPAPNHLGDVQIYQKIGGLPNGHYILECDAMAVNQTNPENDPDNAVEKENYTGVYLYYSDGTITMHGDALASDFKYVENEETGEGAYQSFPAHFVYEFDLSTAADTIMIGLMSENTNLNWMGADNFVLKYAGATQSLPSYTALNGEIATSKNYRQNEPFCEKAAIDAFDAAIAEAETLVAGGADEAKNADYQAAFSKLSAARANVAASVAAYQRLDAFIDKLNTEIDNYDQMDNYGKLVGKLETLVSQMETGRDEQTLTAAQIDEAINGYDALVKETVKEIFDDLVAANQPLETPFEITGLFSDMSYAYGTSQVSFPNGYPAENPVWMNETGTGNFKTNFSTAEVWNANFRIYRDFADLPKGSYTIETKAFYRVADNATNFPAYKAHEYDEGVFATLDAGGVASKITNVAEIASDVENTSGGAQYVDEESGVTWYIPNSQQGASEIFTQEKWAEQGEKCIVRANGLITDEKGTLRVAITGQNLQGNSWVIWHSFRLYYNGEDASAYDDVIRGLIAQTEELLPIVKDAQTKIDAAVQAGNTAIDNDDKNAKVAAIAQLKEAIAYANEGDELAKKLEAEELARAQRIEELTAEGATYTNTSYLELLTEIESLDFENDIETNAQLQNYLDRLANEWDAFVWSKEGINEASVENPVDMSELIVNNSFDNSWTGWTYTTTKGNPGIEASSGNFAEFWNTGAFDIYQTLPTLKEGYWRLEVNALYRPGNDNNVVEVLKQQAEGNDTIMLDNEFLYVRGTGLNMSKKVMAWTNFENGAIKYTVSEEDPETPIFAEADQEAADIIADNRNQYDATAFKFIAPNNRGSMRQFIEGGRYHNVLDFKYVPANGEVKIGLTLLDEITVGSCWCPFDDFKLSYLGNGEAPDAVNGIAAKANVAADQIFSIDGRQKSNVTRGINIVRMSDGSVRKVLVK